MSRKLTPWFPPEIKPVYVGVYSASRWKLSRRFRYWNGKEWGLVGASIEAAMRLCDTTSFSDVGPYVPGISWRGLVRKP